MANLKASVTIKNLAQSPQKLRLVADTIRGKEVSDAKATLQFLNKKGSLFVGNALDSAVANAKDKFGWEADNLYISHISVDEAPTYKRSRWVSRGRGTRILKRRSHLNLELSKKD